ncbi:histidine phosphatase family protein [Actinomadura sp. 9N407]|uniref:histidine phosphatase family protein n=1 Tax=Actinomadura sp. 9N407 TaxID=3375154 RepID=UPI00378CEE40
MIDTAGARAWLIRHGESESNAGLPTAGPGAAPLTPLGRAQAERAAAAFTGPPALIVSSTFVRARETARPTRERYPDVPYEEWPVEEFTFLGHLHGLGTTNAQRAPHAMAYWERCDPAYASTGGESFKDVVARTRDLLGRLARRPEGLTAVFTHGMFMRVLIWSLATGSTDPDAAAMRAFRRFLQVCAVPNGAVLELRGSGGGPEDFQLLAGSFTHLPTVTDTPTPAEP